MASRQLIRNRRWLWLVLLLPVLMISLLVHAPARLLQGSVAGEVRVEQWGGTLLNGQLQGQYQQFPLFVAWQWQPQGLFLLRLQATAQLRSVVSADLSVSRGLLSWTLQSPGLQLAAGQVPGLPAGFVMPAWRSGELTVARARSGVWKAASGRLQTAGGPLRLTLQGQVHDVTLPASQLILRLQAEDLVADLKTADGEALATMTLTGDHRIQWQLRDRLLRLKPGYVSQNDPDLIVLTVAEPLP